MEQSRKCGLPEDTMREVLDACADCDTCRFLMDENCLLFPELYRLYDQGKEDGKPANSAELRKLSELCTLCGLCPCPNIRADVIRSKTERIRNDGMPLGTRLLADPRKFGRNASLAPKAVNAALAFSPVALMVKKISGIHPQRRLPRVARENFFTWARRHGLDREPDRNPKVAYFAGCTAGYFFPEVAQAAVGVLGHNGVSVYVPPQQCCGMPSLLEGDAPTTLQRAHSNMETLSGAVRKGYSPVCSCPTCGFLLKVLLREKAYYSDAYQRSVNAGDDEIKIPDTNRVNSGFVCLKKSMYARILQDDGYFSSFDPLARITLSENISDLGEYLSRLQQSHKLNLRFGTLRGRMVYYAPCHQREQAIGSPYLELLTKIPGLTVSQVGGAMDCCGMGGSLGFKKDFHDASIRLATHLVEKIQAAEPQAIITDCLSCRLQFQHLLPYPVYHPVEILLRAYEQADV